MGPGSARDLSGAALTVHDDRDPTIQRIERTLKRPASVRPRSRRQLQDARPGLAPESTRLLEVPLALEIERRFLVSGMEWQRHSQWQARLRQGYLSRPGDGLTVRVRCSEPLLGQSPLQAWLTLKAPPASGGSARAVPAGQALSRLEFEYAIPPADAEALLSLTDQQLLKIRHGLDLVGGDWVLDVFEDANAPLVVAEVELEHPDQPVELPAWCRREITGRRELSNAALAARPFSFWSETDRMELLHGL